LLDIISLLSGFFIQLMMLLLYHENTSTPGGSNFEVQFESLGKYDTPFEAYRQMQMAVA